MTENEKFQTLCREHHWRCTPQRMAVHAYMMHNFKHPSVDEVWQAVQKEIPSITRESVYRILNEFSEADILYRMDKIESAHYDSQTMPHGHLVCEKCGEVRDFQLAHLPELPPGINPEELHHLEVRFSWICPECRKKN